MLSSRYNQLKSISKRLPSLKLPSVSIISNVKQSSSISTRNIHINIQPSLVKVDQHKQTVHGMLTVDELKKLIKNGEIETIVCSFTDIYGRNMGKRFDADFFIEDCIKNGTHACNYLLTCNMNMDPIDHMKFANWEKGFGDVHLVPDLSTLRIASWQDKSAYVFCDVLDNKTHKYVDIAPRSILRSQIDSANTMAGYKILAASELEYYTYNTTFREAAENGYELNKMNSVSAHIQDYHTLQTAREEPFHIAARKALKHSGVPVETTKGEAGIGQHELNIKYSDVLAISDRHQIYKQCMKEIADKMGMSITFMAKPYHEVTGSGCHLHMSLWKDGKNAFVGDKTLGSVTNCSDDFKHFMGGWIQHTADLMPFYAPTINSYKRFVSSSWAPTRLVWSYDNRTAGFRVVGSGNSLRIECRIPGADANPYLAMAASLASGLDGIRNKISPPACFDGNVYEAKSLPQVPLSLKLATERFEKSEFTKRVFGKHVVEHYARFYHSEIEAYEKSVTDWERKRYFEQI